MIILIVILSTGGIALYFLNKSQKASTDIEDRKKETAQGFVNVKDIRDKFLYTRDKKVISYIQITPIDINLLNKKEKKILASDLTSELASERREFKFLAVSRPTNISPLLADYQGIMANTSNQKQKELLRHEMLYISDLALSGEVVERQMYFMLWEDYEEGIERDLLKRSMEFISKISTTKIKADILNENKIIRLCNLVNNPAFATTEDINIETIVPFILEDA